jgi:hypothetical protein
MAESLAGTGAGGAAQKRLEARSAARSVFWARNWAHEATGDGRRATGCSEKTPTNTYRSIGQIRRAYLGPLKTDV